MASQQVTVNLMHETPTARFAPSPWAIIIRNGQHKDRVVQPLSFGGDPAARPANRVAVGMAIFDSRAVHDGEFDLAVVTHDPSDGERTCTISAEDALRIR
jgi:hypothetical protein